MAVQIGKILRTIPTGPMPAARPETIREAIEAIYRAPPDKKNKARIEGMYDLLTAAEQRATGSPG